MDKIFEMLTAVLESPTCAKDIRHGVSLGSLHLDMDPLLKYKRSNVITLIKTK